MTGRSRAMKRGGHSARAPLCAVFLFACAWLAGLGGCGANAARARKPLVETPTAVRLSKVVCSAVELPVHAAGKLGGEHELELAFRTGGVLRRVLVSKGTRVWKGQLLALVDATEPQAQLVQARRAQEKAERDRARAAVLLKEGSLSLVAMQDAQTEASMARAAAAIAAYNLRQTRLFAPEDAVVDDVLLQSGEIVSPHQPVLHLSASGQGPVVKVELVDRDALAVQKGDRARVWIDARPGWTLASHVSRIATASSPGLGTFTVELTLDDRRALTLPSGLSAKAEIAHVEADLAQVPVAALVDGEGQQAAVFTVHDEHAKRVSVAIQKLSAERALLSGSYPDLDNVVVAGAPLLRDGSPVRVVR